MGILVNVVRILRLALGRVVMTLDRATRTALGIAPRPFGISRSRGPLAQSRSTLAKPTRRPHPEVFSQIVPNKVTGPARRRRTTKNNKVTKAPERSTPALFVFFRFFVVQDPCGALLPALSSRAPGPQLGIFMRTRLITVSGALEVLETLRNPSSSPAALSRTHHRLGDSSTCGLQAIRPAALADARLRRAWALSPAPGRGRTLLEAVSGSSRCHGPRANSRSGDPISAHTGPAMEAAHRRTLGDALCGHAHSLFCHA